jgi:hypothetical protein
MTYFKILTFAYLILMVSVSSAGVICDSEKCSYTGKITTVYVNTSGQILIYLDKSYPELLAGAQALGLSTVTSSNALVLRMYADDGSIDSKRAEVAKLFYASALSAQATGAEVTIQARVASSGYMMADRIWLK